MGACCASPHVHEDWTQTPCRCSYDEESRRSARLPPTIDSHLPPPCGSRLPPIATPGSHSPPPEFISVFNAVKDKVGIDELIQITKQLLQCEESKQQNKPYNGSTSFDPIQEIEKKQNIWPTFINSGSDLLQNVIEYMDKNPDKQDSNEGTKVSTEMLQHLEQSYWVVAGLSMIAYLLSKIDIVSENRTECLRLLRCMTELAQHLKDLKNMTPQEEKAFENAILLICEGSILFASQLHSNKFSRIMKSSVDSILRKVNEFYPDLELTGLIETTDQLSNYLPIRKAVGIERPVDEVLDLLKRTTDMSSVAVVIYGVGGIGKTTLAEAVVANMDLSHYNYTRVDMYQEPRKNDFKSIQQQILDDCFPTYNPGKPIKLRDCAEGRSVLREAFQCKENKPFFLFIDNALWSLDLKEIFPEDLGGLPQRSRILVTTRYLAATDMFQTPTLQRKPYSLSPLPSDAALDILLEDRSKRSNINSDDLNRMLRICKGIPLVLKIFGSQLLKEGYEVDKCARLFETLEKAGPNCDDDLTHRLFSFVYGELEGYFQDAFLDICSFFNNWKRRHVEYIVGAMAVTYLLEAALITTTAMHSESNLDEEKLVVHDTILEKGRRIAESSRIIDVESLSEAADEERLHRIKGIWLVEEESEYVFDQMHLNALSKSLRVLALGNRIGLSDTCEMDFEEVRFLRIGGDISHSPVMFGKLDKLAVYHGPVFTEGSRFGSKLPIKLFAVKAMQESHDYKESPISGMAPVLQCRSLEEIDFTGSCKLHKLTEGLHQLDALKILILDNCYGMQELPEQVCQLPSLRRLSMRSWECLKCLPEMFGQLTSLTHLQLSHCGQLEKLPSTFGELRALKYLNLEFCLELKTLPPNFHQLAALRRVNLTRCDARFRSAVRHQISRKVKCIGCEDID